MTDELRSLLDRLQRDGVDAGKQQADVVLRDAQQQAARIVAEAKAEAERYRAETRADAERTVVRTRQQLQHAARDLLLVVGQRLEEIVRRILVDRTVVAFDGPTVIRLTEHLIEAFVARGRGAGALEVLVGPAQKELLTDAVLHALRDKLQQGVTLRVQAGVGPGFQIRMGDGGVTHDFTAAAIASALADLVTPEIAAIVLAAAVEPIGAPA